jgi:hypothetical protein
MPTIKFVTSHKQKNYDFDFLVLLCPVVKSLQTASDLASISIYTRLCKKFVRRVKILKYFNTAHELFTQP